MKIAHFSDLHIRLYKEYKQYQIIFDNFFELLKKYKPDYNIFCGDLFHNKYMSLSGESIDLAVKFLNGLSLVAPTFLIIGNHDVALKNTNRLDALSPLVIALNNKNIRFFKYTQSVEFKDGYILNVYSILDKENWKNIEIDKTKLNIALYHGIINTTKLITDVGWKISGGVEIEQFYDNDYLMAGDIHLSQSISSMGYRNKRKIPEGKYSGDMIQQNFGENLVKGFLLWDIESKETFTYDFIEVNNPYPFVTVKLENDCLPQNIDLKPGSKVRLLSDVNLSYETTQNVIESVRSRFKPESIIFIPIQNKPYINIDTIDDNLRDVNVQERLIREFLKEQNISEPVMKKVLELNKKYKTIVEKNEEVTGGIHWKLKEFEWDNLFNYGEGNKINFENINGIVGLFGKSAQGKTSVIDAIAYTIFNSISKNSRKNYNIINQNKNYGRGKVVIDIDGKNYVIERVTEKYIKKLKGSITEEGKTDVSFQVLNNDFVENLNGFERNDTDNNIRKIFGTIDEFLLTAVSSQFGSMSFINEGSTKRKEILFKFLDLEIFDSKFKLAKEDFSSIRSSLKKIEDKDYEDLIKKINEELEEEKNNFLQINDKILLSKKQFYNVQTEISEIDFEIKNSAIKSDLDIEQILKNIKKLEEQKREVENICQKTEEKVNINMVSLEKIDNFLFTFFDIEDFKQKKEEIKQKQLQLSQIEKEVQFCNHTINLHQKQSKLIDEVPCGPRYSDCKFIKGAYQSRKIIEEQKVYIKKYEEEEEEIVNKIKKLEPEKTDECIERHNKLLNKKQLIISEISDSRIENIIKKQERQKITTNISDWCLKQQEYEKNQEIIANLKEFRIEKNKRENNKNKIEKELNCFETQMLEISRKCGSLEQQLSDFKNKKTELQLLREEYSAYELFLQCMHASGVISEILKRKLVVINNEISKILAEIVNFRVFFEVEDNNLNVLIQYPSFLPRPLELASGAEKTIGSLAIRLSLIKTAYLNRANFIILDEPVVSCDDKIVEGFSKLLDLMKEHFDFIILISHSDVLKDLVDTEIIISKNENKYAYINC